MDLPISMFRFHKLSSVMTHVIEGPFTFLCFGNEAMRAIAFFGFLGLTSMYVFSQNIYNDTVLN